MVGRIDSQDDGIGRRYDKEDKGRMTYTEYKFRCRICRRFIPYYGSGVDALYSSTNAGNAPKHHGRRTLPVPFEIDNYSLGGKYRHEGGVDIGHGGR